MRVRPITDWEQVPIIFDLPFAARILGLSPETIKKRAQRGDFPAFKEGNEWRVEKTALLEHIRSNSAKRPDTATA